MVTMRRPSGKKEIRATDLLGEKPDVVFESPKTPQSVPGRDVPPKIVLKLERDYIDIGGEENIVFDGQGTLVSLVSSPINVQSLLESLERMPMFRTQNMNMNPSIEYFKLAEIFFKGKNTLKKSLLQETFLPPHDEQCFQPLLVSGTAHCLGKPGVLLGEKLAELLCPGSKAGIYEYQGVSNFIRRAMRAKDLGQALFLRDCLKAIVAALPRWKALLRMIFRFDSRPVWRYRMELLLIYPYLGHKVKITYEDGEEEGVLESIETDITEENVDMVMILEKEPFSVVIKDLRLRHKRDWEIVLVDKEVNVYDPDCLDKVYPFGSEGFIF